MSLEYFTDLVEIYITATVCWYGFKGALALNEIRKGETLTKEEKGFLGRPLIWDIHYAGRNL